MKYFKSKINYIHRTLFLHGTFLPHFEIARPSDKIKYTFFFYCLTDIKCNWGNTVTTSDPV